MLEVRRWGWVLWVAFLAGCGASSADKQAGYDPYGGQTGSLRPERPDCGGAPSFDAMPTLPAGDAVFVYYDDACAADAGDFALTDADGSPLDVTLEPLEGGGVLVKTDEALTPGNYELESPSGTRAVVVAEPAPLPSELGTLTTLDGCPAALSLRFGDEVKPYLPLLALSYRIDGGELETWYDYGLIAPDAQEVTLDLGWCPGPCLGDGTFDIEIVASIAGESAQPDPLTAEVSQACSASTDAGGACSVAEPVPRRSVSGGCLLFALLLVGGVRRRRRPSAKID